MIKIELQGPEVTPVPAENANPAVAGCWRCGGAGHVTMPDGEQTPCGACLNVARPLPCPECGADQAKLLVTGDATDCWYCRVCGFRGPEVLLSSTEDTSKALLKWNKLPRKAVDNEV